MAEQLGESSRSGRLAPASINHFSALWASLYPVPVFSKLPITSTSRITEATITDQQLPLDATKTVLYLAYGSNLSAETFQGRRGIKPLSAINVRVPSLDLTFDLPGIPYIEPCFANTRYRKPPLSNTDYHKDRWHKGLIGVVYEVTPEDYRTIIATEGGGASYHDVIVPCYAIPPGMKGVDPNPHGVPFKAHTLFAPSESKKGRTKARPDPSYAQASARYLKLITDGAEEHKMPTEYITYLYNIRPYTITTYRQRLGQASIIAAWLPFLLFLLGLTRILADEDGRIPKWLVKVQEVVFGFLWATYDGIFKKIFGDGERTMKGSDEEEALAFIETMRCEKGIPLGVTD